MSCNLEVTYLEVTNLCFVNVISFVYRYYNNYVFRTQISHKKLKFYSEVSFLDIRARPSLNLLKSLFDSFKVRFLQYA